MSKDTKNENANEEKECDQKHTEKINLNDEQNYDDNCNNEENTLNNEEISKDTNNKNANEEK